MSRFTDISSRFTWILCRSLDRAVLSKLNTSPQSFGLRSGALNVSVKVVLKKKSTSESIGRPIGASPVRGSRSSNMRADNLPNRVVSIDIFQVLQKMERGIINGRWGLDEELSRAGSSHLSPIYDLKADHTSSVPQVCAHPLFRRAALPSGVSSILHRTFSSPSTARVPSRYFPQKQKKWNIPKNPDFSTAFNSV